jgi:hypothetical protein
MTKKGSNVRSKREGIDSYLTKVDEYTREMATARKIQQYLLPDVPPDLRGVRMACCSIPAHLVGGDYYDFFRWDDSSLDLVIADVSGHNLGRPDHGRGAKRAPSPCLPFRKRRDALAVVNELLYDD